MASKKPTLEQRGERILALMEKYEEIESELIKECKAYNEEARLVPSDDNFSSPNVSQDIADFLEGYGYKNLSDFIESNEMNNNNTDDVVIAPGATYFLHVTAAGTELRFEREPRDLPRKTHFVRVISVNGDEVIEETTLTGIGIPHPHGAGWKHVGGTTWRRKRQQ